MRRKSEKRDETEEISLVDTQEYFTAPRRDVPPPEPETEVISDETAEYEAFPGEEAGFESETREQTVSDETVEFDELDAEELEEDAFVGPEDEGEYAEDEGRYVEEDLYEEPFDDDFYDEPIDREPEPAKKKDGPEPVLDRMKIAWASLMADASKIELPSFGGKGRDGDQAKAGKAKGGKGKGQGGDTGPVGVDENANPSSESKDAAGSSGISVGRAGAIAAILAVSLLVGIGAYLIGRGSGEDVTAAKLEGQAAGKKAGAIEGAAKGYPAGFQKGRDAGFRKAYVNAYKINYKRAFEQAGQDAPADKDIDVPDP